MEQHKIQIPGHAAFSTVKKILLKMRRASNSSFFRNLTKEMTIPYNAKQDYPQDKKRRDFIDDLADGKMLQSGQKQSDVFSRCTEWRIAGQTSPE